MHPRKKQFRSIILSLDQEFLHQFQAKPTRSNQSLLDRVRRSLSWLKRAAEVSEEDRPPRFVDLWIGFNALYGTRRYGDDHSAGEYQDFTTFLASLLRLSSGTEQLVELMGKKYFQGRVRDLIQNKYLWNQFWDRKEEDFVRESGRELKTIEHALRNRDVTQFYSSMFQRLKVLRNQIFHGSASADTRRNKDALIPAVLVLEELVRLFIKLMIEHGQRCSWAEVPYPASRTPLHPVHDQK